jgi:DeoR/GlpR family transcriptional regulator of sugar metabolism
MRAKQRQDRILEILNDKGYATVKYLSNELHYSTATVNRDLNELQHRQLIIRSYGGAEPVRSAYVPILFRSQKMRVEKRNIGRVAASFVSDGDTIFIDGSTTAQCMEQHLINKKGLTVITNNIMIAVNLSKYDIKVICLGGSVVEAPSMLCGTETVENAARYRVDKMFFSTAAVSSDGIVASGIHYDMLFSTVARGAKKIFYLVDRKKVDQPFNKIYCSFDNIDCVISDHRFSAETKKRYPDTEFVLVEKGDN